MTMGPTLSLSVHDLHLRPSPWSISLYHLHPARSLSLWSYHHLVVIDRLSFRGHVGAPLLLLSGPPSPNWVRGSESATGRQNVVTTRKKQNGSSVRRCCTSRTRHRWRHRSSCTTNRDPWCWIESRCLVVKRLKWLWTSLGYVRTVI